MKSKICVMSLKGLMVVMAIVVLASSALACTQATPTSSPQQQPTQQPTQPPSTTKPAAPTQKPPEVTPGKQYAISFQSMFPSTHVSGPIIKLWADRVEQRSNGQIKITLFWAGQLVGPNEALDALGKGSIDGLLAAPTSYSGKVPVGDFTTMPYNAKDMSDFYDVWLNTPLRDIVEKEYREKANVEPIGFQTTAGYPLLMAKNKAVTKLEDMKGLKIRGGGGAANELLKALGATPVTVVGAETVMAMDRGTVDGALLTYPSMESYQMYDMVTDITEPYVIPVFGVMIWLNLDKYNSLPDNLRLLLKQVWKDNQQEDIKSMSDDEAKAKGKVAAKGTRVYTLPKEEVARWKNAMLPVWDWYVQRAGEPGQRIKGIIQARW